MSMKALRVLGLIALAIVICVALIGCGGSSSGGATSGGTQSGGGSPGGGATIVEQGIAFQPTQMSVKVGEAVTFANEDSSPHNVKIDGKELGMQNQGQSVTWTPEKTGVFPFSCVIHPSMTGEITVE